MDPTTPRPLGKTGLDVTVLGLGTAPLGGLFSEVDDATAHATVRRAWELGLRLYDTAPLYGHGLAERRLGHELAGHPRDEYVLATKVGRLLRADAPPDPSQHHGGDPFYKGVPNVNPVRDYSAAGVLRSIEESLERLGLDRVDVVHVHDPDDYFEQVLATAYPALDRLRREGVVRAISVGMNQAQMLTRFARAADFDCFLLAGRYTLLDQSALAELLPTCQERGIAVLAGGVYNSGVLARPDPGARFDYVPAPAAVIEQARKVAAVCDRHGVPLMAAALQFPLSHPAVAAVLTGVRSVAELEQNERMFRTAVPADVWDELRAEGLLPQETS